MTVLVTGAAGFIGSNLCDKLLKSGYRVIGVDNFNDYYNPKIKEENIEEAKKNKDFFLYRVDILDFEKLKKVFQKEMPDIVIHLAARAGVRPSISDPILYTDVNVVGTINLLKLSVDYKVKKFIFASSSSVYGNSESVPFSEVDLCQRIISPYGASKRSAEFFVESFYKNFGLKSVVLRFFTVYGKRGRPDMAPAIFTKAILEGKPIKQFGDGSSSRDYTYIDDIVDGIMRAVEKPLDFAIINLGNNHPVKLSDFIRVLEKISDKPAKVKRLGRQSGDVERTWASIDVAKKLLNWSPCVKLTDGIKEYINWYRSNHEAY